jgi:hypothetical protein
LETGGWNGRSRIPASITLYPSFFLFCAIGEKEKTSETTKSPIKRVGRLWSASEDWKSSGRKRKTALRALRPLGGANNFVVPCPAAPNTLNPKPYTPRHAITPYCSTPFPVATRMRSLEEAVMLSSSLSFSLGDHMSEALPSTVALVMLCST